MLKEMGTEREQMMKELRKTGLEEARVKRTLKLREREYD